MEQNKNILLCEATVHEGGIKTENILYESKNVLKTSYNYNTQRLIDTYKGSKAAYQFMDVPNDIYEGIKTAESCGSYISKTFRKYTFLKMADLSEELYSLLNEEITKLINDKTIL